MIRLIEEIRQTLNTALGYRYDLVKAIGHWVWARGTRKVRSMSVTTAFFSIEVLVREGPQSLSTTLLVPKAIAQWLLYQLQFPADIGMPHGLGLQLLGALDCPIAKLCSVTISYHGDMILQSTDCLLLFYRSGWVPLSMSYFTGSLDV